MCNAPKPFEVLDIYLKDKNLEDINNGIFIQ
jgi:hypothetical protein